jgi:putative toxin-antitoxin system antitoxin component (TIGR02293 family)
MLYEALSLKERSLGGVAWHDAAVAGFSGRSLNSLARHLGVKPAELAELVGVDPQTFRANVALSGYVSDALYRLALALQRANVAFKDEAKAAAWLTGPQSALAGRTPVSLMLTDAGAADVWTALEKIPKKIAKERANTLVEG